jgi:hypothetical protein
MANVPSRGQSERVLSNEQRAAGYYRIAYQCEETKKQGCNGYCGNCPLNVSLYEPNPRDAVLIKTSAAIDYAAQRQRDQDSLWQSVGTLIGWLIAIYICFVWPILSIQSCITDSSKKQRSAAVDRPVQVQQLATQTTKVERTLVTATANGTLQTVYKRIRNIYPNTGRNHLFDAVADIKGILMYAEAQGNNNTWPPDVFWGSAYSLRYNVDEAEYWTGWIKGYNL